MLGGDTKTLAVSVAIHGGVLVALGFFATRQVTKPEEPLEFEVITMVPAAKVPEVIEPPDPDPPPVPVAKRPHVVPKRVRIRVTRKPTPYQPDPPDTNPTKEAPPDTAAVPAPTAPVREVEMESTVGAGAGNYSSTATNGTVAVGKGPGGDGVGPGRGAPGTLGNQGAVGVKVSRDWEITQMPKPLNDRSFEPRYPPRARREKREGNVVVRLYIDDQGRVHKALAIRGPKGHGFRVAAVEYAKKLRFRPAFAGRRKVAARIDWTVLFYVRN